MEGYSQPKTWSLKKRLAPKNSIDPPSGKRNSEGELVTIFRDLHKKTYT